MTNRTAPISRRCLWHRFTWLAGIVSGVLVVAIPMQMARADFLAGPRADSTKRADPTQLDDVSLRLDEIQLAIKHFETRDIPGCLSELSKAVKAHPELPPPHALLAKLASLANQGALIRPALERAVLEDPTHPEVFILLGNLAIVEARTADAAVHFEKAAALTAGTRWTREQKTRFELLLAQGNAVVAERREDWKGAKQALETWLKNEPKQAAARQRLAKAHFALGETGAAFDELKKAAEYDPQLEPAPLTMGWLYTKAGNRAKAKEWFDFAVKSAPQSLPVRMGAAAWLLEQGRAEEAQVQADAAAKLDPRAREVRRMLGLVARERKDLAHAESVFQALALESPGDAWVRNQLALVLADQADETKRRRALELAELSVRQAPNAPEALGTLGAVLYRTGRLEDAETVLETLVSSGKASSDSVYVLALVRADRGHPERAPELLKMALDAPGLFVCRRDAQEWLDRLSRAPQ